MKKIKIYQVDAFTDKLFSGNSAAVCILEDWISDDLMQSIGMENNLAETAFVVPMGDKYGIRWFTPTVEVDLCGHATLAAGYILLKYYNTDSSIVFFNSHRSGDLTVFLQDEKYFLDFPTDILIPIAEKDRISSCINCRTMELYKGKTDYLAVIESEKELRSIKPDLIQISSLESRGLIVTARGDSVDFVSRFFAPQSGIDEDPVTGSAHTTLTPLWSEKLGKTKLSALQLSKRGGELTCMNRGSRCWIGGDLKLFMEGEIIVD